MSKKEINLRWKAVKADPDPTYNHWHVNTIKGFEICTTYADENGTFAKQIASDHNEQLKVKKALAKTPFAKESKS